MDVTSWILTVLTCHGVAGIAFASIFITCWMSSFDRAAKGSSIAFRLIIMPGVVVLWPIVLVLALRRRQTHGGTT